MSDTLALGAREPEPCVLVVDDDHRVRELLEIAFTNQGYRVITAGDGDEAVTRAAEQLPDLVILDVRLPRKSGLEVCEALRNSGRETPVAIIMVSAAVENELRLQSFSRGADDYLTKPFSPRELVARARRLIARTRELSRARGRVAELERELRRSWEESRRARDENLRASRRSEALEAARQDLDPACGLEVMSRALLARVRAELGAHAALLLTRTDSGLVPIASTGVEGDVRGLNLRHGPLEEALAPLDRPASARALESLPGVAAELGPFVAAGLDCFIPICHHGTIEALIALSGAQGLQDRERVQRAESLCRIAAATFADQRLHRDRALDLARMLSDAARSRGYGAAHFEVAAAIERAARAAGLTTPWPALAALAVELRGSFEEVGGAETLARLAVLDPTGIVATLELLASGSEAPDEGAELAEARRFVELGTRIADRVAAGDQLRVAVESIADEPRGPGAALRMALEDPWAREGGVRASS